MILKVEFISCRIEVVKCSRSVNYAGVFCVENSSRCINLVSCVLIRKSIDNIFKEDIIDEIEHLSNFRLLKIRIIE